MNIPIGRVLSLKGNPLDEDDGNLLNEVVLDRLMKMMAAYLMKLCLIEYVLMNLLNDVNLMYLQRVQKVMKKGIQYVLDL